MNLRAAFSRRGTERLGKPTGFPDASPSISGLRALETAHGAIRAAPARLLMLDYDGTLAPFQADRRDARPAPGMLAVLRAVAARPATTLVIVSGRPTSELRSFLPRVPARWIGENGWEELEPNGTLLSHELPGAASHRLGLAFRAASACGWGPRLERKRTAVVMHTRGMDPEVTLQITGRCRMLWGTFFERDGLMLETTDGGLELRAAGRTKGTAVADLMRRSRPGTLPVYIGDDLCDEPAFRAVRPHGLTLRVGSSTRATHAEWLLPTVEDVRHFLEAWLDPWEAQPPGEDAPRTVG